MGHIIITGIAGVVVVVVAVVVVVVVIAIIVVFMGQYLSIYHFDHHML